MIDGDQLRDESAHGCPHDMGGINAKSVEQAGGIACHVVQFVRG